MSNERMLCTPDEATHEMQRRKLWKDVAIAYTNSGNSTNPRYAKDWADKILEAFDLRFEQIEVTKDGT